MEEFFWHHTAAVHNSLEEFGLRDGEFITSHSDRQPWEVIFIGFKKCNGGLDVLVVKFKFRFRLCHSHTHGELLHNHVFGFIVA